MKNPIRIPVGVLPNKCLNTNNSIGNENPRVIDQVDKGESPSKILVYQ